MSCKFQRTSLNFMAPVTRRCPESVLTRTTAGTRSPNNQRDRQRFLARGAAILLSHATRFRFLLHPSRSNAPMSALGQKQTYAAQNMMSALHPKPDMCAATRDVCLGARADIHRHHIIDIVLSKSSRITAREPDALSLIFFVPTLAFKLVVFPESVLVCWDPVGRLWRLHAMSCLVR